MSALKEFTKGFLRENPVFVICLGLCPTLATSSQLKNGLGMGLAATFVLVCSNVIISLLRKLTPQKIRIPIFIVVIATFVVIVELVLKAYVPALSQSLGIFIPLIVVNCIILGRAEAFAQKNGVLPSFLDGLGMGLGFTLALGIVATIREVLGFGTFFGMPVFGEGFEPATIMAMAPGAFITIGLLMGYFNLRKQRKARRALSDADTVLRERQSLSTAGRNAA